MSVWKPHQLVINTNRNASSNRSAFEAITVKRYSAKLLFQFRVIIDGDSGKRRMCEERLLVLQATSARAALTKAKRKGRGSQFHYKNSDGNPVHFEFVGVMDLLCLEVSCEPDEV